MSVHDMKTREFTSFLKTTLIPDLRESGTDSIADDFEKCLAIIERQRVLIKMLAEEW